MWLLLQAFGVLSKDKLVGSGDYKQVKRPDMNGVNKKKRTGRRSCDSKLGSEENRETGRR